ncbi:DUF3105 domain-containing protein [Streptomyces sp. NPDC058459]|uniref:DUF3105 domain-containing protein n=1 Tax=Streptomyces sp. NPDC058459 TaxID=3346508 RepID=UPI0036499693
MGTDQHSPASERAARVEEMRRAERTRARRNRVLAVAASVVVVAGLAVGGVVLVRSQSDSDGGKDTAADAKGGSGHFTTGADGVRTWSGKLSRTHVSTRVTYPMRPPVGGDHNPAWLNCDGDVYKEPVRDENAVHALEHGAVWVTYTGKARKADVDALAAKVKRTPYSLMSPYTDQDAPLVLSAWGHQVSVKSAADPEVDKFFAAYVQGEQTPEPGAPCTGGVMK